MLSSVNKVDHYGKTQSTEKLIVDRYYKEEITRW